MHRMRILEMQIIIAVLFFSTICHSSDIRISSTNVLEVFDGTTWGTVCHDFFDQVDADVACRELGYRVAYFWTIGEVEGSPDAIHLDSVNCNGSETSLLHCQHEGLGVHACDHSEDVGLSCRQEDIRIAEGNLLETFIGPSWGTVCGYHFGQAEADVACRELGYKHAHFWTMGEVEGAPDVINMFTCDGNETSLLQCDHKCVGAHECNHTEDVGLTCYQEDIRILNGNLLEVFDGTTWGTVCDDYFGQVEANVACKELGYRHAQYWTIGEVEGAPDAIHLDEVKCDGSETSLLFCKSKGIGVHACEHTEDVGLSCHNEVKKTVAEEAVECSQYRVGDGTGGSEKVVGSVSSMDECVQLVHKTQPTANGATMSNPDSNNPPFTCWAEFTQTAANTSPSYVNCFVVKKTVAEEAVECSQYRVGDGTGGSEKVVGSVSSMDECVQLVHKTQPTANGATMSNPDRNNPPFTCWAEFTQTAANTSPSYVNCFIEQSASGAGDSGIKEQASTDANSVSKDQQPGPSTSGAEDSEEQAGADGDSVLTDQQPAAEELLAVNEAVAIGDHFIQFGPVWRLAAFDDAHLSLSHKDSGGTPVIFRGDGTVQRAVPSWTGWASGRATAPKGVHFGMDTIQIGNWRIGSPDNGVHFSVAYRNPDNNQIKTCVIFRRDGTVHYGNGQRSDYHTFGQSIFHSNVKYVSQGLEIGGWRIGEWDDSHFPIQAATGYTAMIYRKDSTAHPGNGVRRDYNSYHGANKREVLWPATRTGVENLVWVDVARSWPEARDECVARGGWLWAPKLANLRKEQLNQQYWTGWNDFQQEGVFLDMSGKTLQPNSKAWADEEPNDSPDRNTPGDENCVEKRTDNKLNDLKCDRQLKFFCQIDDPTNPLFKYRTDKRSFEQAALACKQDGDNRLFRPRTKQELKTVGSRAAIGDDGFWVGYIQEANEGGWRGATKTGKPSGHPMPDDLWHENEPNNAGGHEDCVNKLRDQDDGLNDMSCDHAANFICTRL